MKNRKPRPLILIRCAEARRKFFIPYDIRRYVLRSVTWGHYDLAQVKKLCPTGTRPGPCFRNVTPKSTRAGRAPRRMFWSGSPGRPNAHAHELRLDQTRHLWEPLGLFLPEGKPASGSGHHDAR